MFEYGVHDVLIPLLFRDGLLWDVVRVKGRKFLLDHVRDDRSVTLQNVRGIELKGYYFLVLHTKTI